MENKCFKKNKLIITLEEKRIIEKRGALYKLYIYSIQQNTIKNSSWNIRFFCEKKISRRIVNSNL